MQSGDKFEPRKVAIGLFGAGKPHALERPNADETAGLDTRSCK